MRKTLQKWIPLGLSAILLMYSLLYAAVNTTVSSEVDCKLEIADLKKKFYTISFLNATFPSKKLTNILHGIEDCLRLTNKSKAISLSLDNINIGPSIDNPNNTDNYEVKEVSAQAQESKNTEYRPQIPMQTAVSNTPQNIKPSQDNGMLILKQETDDIDERNCPNVSVTTANQTIERLQKRLNQDPNSPDRLDISHDIAYYYYCAGQYKASAQWIIRVFSVDANYPAKPDFIEDLLGKVGMADRTTILNFIDTGMLNQPFDMDGALGASSFSDDDKRNIKIIEANLRAKNTAITQNLNEDMTVPTQPIMSTQQIKQEFDTVYPDNNSLTNNQVQSLLNDEYGEELVTQLDVQNVM